MRFTQNPITFEREIEILYELGADLSELQYIQQVKHKTDIEKKWIN